MRFVIHLAWCFTAFVTACQCGVVAWYCSLVEHFASEDDTLGHTRADPKRSCDRCGCRFDPAEPQCPVCGDGGEDELERARRLAG